MSLLKLFTLTVTGSLICAGCESSSSPSLVDAMIIADGVVQADTTPTKLPDAATAPDPGLPWAKQLGGSGTDEGAAIAVDPQGNIYLTGWFSDTVDFGDGPKASKGEEDLFITSYDAAGKFRWAQQFGGPATDQGFGLAVAGDAVIIVGGFESSAIDFGATHVENRGGEDIFILNLDLSGKPRWAKVFGDLDHQRATAVTIDALGNFALTGFFTGEFDLGGQSLKTSGDFDVDIFVASYQSDGVLRWAKRFGNGMYDRGRAITFDSGGGVIVAGEFIFEVNFGGGSLEAVDKTDAFAASFDRNGTYRWATHFGGAEYDSAYGLAVDSDGNVVLVGQFGKEVDFDGKTATANGKYDAFLAGLDTSGKVRWHKTISSPGPDRGYGVALDGAGNAYFTGEFQETAVFDGGELLSVGGSDVYLISYDSAGAYRWAERLGGSDYENGAGVTVGPAGEVITCGYFSGELEGPEGTLTATGGRDTFIWRHVPR